MKRFLKVIDRISEQSGKAVSFLIVFLVFVILYEISARYLFNSPTIWAHEIAQMIYGAYVILLGAYVLQRGGHVNVDILYHRFHPRTRAIIDLFTWLLFFYFCGLLLLKGGEMAWDSLKILEYSQTIWGPPIYPVKLTIPIGALFLLLQAIAQFLRNLNVFFKERNQR